MGINYIKDRKIIHLSTKAFSYYIHINKFNHLIHLYFGEPLEDISKERCSERYMERYAQLRREIYAAVAKDLNANLSES